MFLYVEQDVNLAWQSCSGHKHFKIVSKNVKNLGKSCFAVRKERINNYFSLRMNEQANEVYNECTNFTIMQLFSLSPHLRARTIVFIARKSIPMSK